MTIAVDLLVFEQFDLLDLGGPYEVFHAANRLAARRDRAAEFSPRTVGASGRPVRASGGLTVTPDTTVARAVQARSQAAPSGDGAHRAAAADDGPAARVAVIPGAIDIDAVVGDGTTLQAIRSLADAADLVVSVCTGSVLLGAAGRLVGVAGATTHHEDLEVLARYLDVGEVVSDVRWVDAGTVVTGGGLSSGLSTALHVVHRLVAPQLARAVAANLEHAWSPHDGVTLAAQVPGTA